MKFQFRSRQKQDNHFIHSFIQKNVEDIEHKLPDWAKANIYVDMPSPKYFNVTVKIQGLGKTLVVGESGEDCYHAVRLAKRKALSRAQSLLRKKRKKWRRPFIHNNLDIDVPDAV